MANPKGNPSTLKPKEKYIESPEKLWELFMEYKKSVKGDPYLVKDWVGKDADQVYREKEKPLILDGFECYLFDKGIIGDLSHYFANTNGKYDAYLTICSRIRKEIKTDHIGGGMAGIYNPSITQRLNNLVEKVANTDSEGKDKPDIFVLGKINKVDI